MLNQSDIDRVFSKYLDAYSTQGVSPVPWMEASNLNIEVTDVESYLSSILKDFNDDFHIEIKSLFFKENLTKKENLFLDLFSIPTSTEIRSLVYLVCLKDAKIKKIKMDYEEKKKFKLEITLTVHAPPSHIQKEVYFSSEDIFDAVVIRNFGIMKLDDKPIFSGYYLPPSN